MATQTLLIDTMLLMAALEGREVNIGTIGDVKVNLRLYTPEEMQEASNRAQEDLPEDMRRPLTEGQLADLTTAIRVTAAIKVER
jgi:hypothetical protein